MGRINTASCAILLILAGTAAVAKSPATEDGGELMPVVRLSPAVRSTDRDAGFYQAIPCRELGAAEARAPAEKEHLSARKQACLEQYRQFAPRSFQP